MSKYLLISMTVCMSGCFPSVAQVETECAVKYNPQTSEHLYTWCVDTRIEDIQTRRAAVARGFQQAGAAFQQNNSVNCVSNCNYGTCYTTCR
jgi:hypothetical protein